MSILPEKLPADAGTLFTYDAASGELYNRKTGRLLKGKAVRYSMGCGLVATPKLIWFLYYGVWPQTHVLHIDGDDTNNRIGNLSLRAHATDVPNCPKPPAQSSLKTKLAALYKFKNQAEELLYDKYGINWIYVAPEEELKVLDKINITITTVLVALP